MNDTNSHINDDYSGRISNDLSRLEYSIQHLEYRMDKEVPTDLVSRITVLEERFNSEISVLKKEFSYAKESIKEKYTLYAIIITLVIALVTAVSGII